MFRPDASAHAECPEPEPGADPRASREATGGGHQEPGLPEPGQRLGEGKNGAVIRRHIGYGHIPSQHAEALHKFYARYLNPYLKPLHLANLLMLHVHAIQ